MVTKRAVHKKLLSARCRLAPRPRQEFQLNLNENSGDPMRYPFRYGFLKFFPRIAKPESIDRDNNGSEYDWNMRRCSKDKDTDSSKATIDKKMTTDIPNEGVLFPRYASSRY